MPRFENALTFGVLSDYATEIETWPEGDKSTGRKYGDDLVCVRYRYDETSRTRIKTVELIVHEIAVLKPMTLLEKAPQDYPVSNRESGKILAGEHVMVLRMGYGKDFRAWKVRGSVGQEGWFIE